MLYYIASLYGHVKIIKFLYDSRVPIDFTEYPILKIAIENGYFKIVKFFCDNFPKIISETIQGKYCPILLAC